MKNVFFSCLTFLLLLFSCDNKSETNLIYHLALQNDKVEYLTSNIEEKDNLVNYTYIHSKDSIKNIFLKYDSNKNVLISDLDTFFISNKSFKTKNVIFGMYQKKEIKSHNTTLVFNKDYGLFATLGYGANFLFLKDSISASQKEIIYKQLFLNLNKINIE